MKFRLPSSRILPLLLAATTATASSQDGTSMCGQLTDVPVPQVAFHPSGERAPLERTHPLFRDFSQGDGRFTQAADSNRAPLRTAPGVQLQPLPWSMAAERERAARLVTWSGDIEGNDESMLAIVLRDGEGWCSTTERTTFRRGSRLRFEAASIEQSAPSTLHVFFEQGRAQRTLFSGAIDYPESLQAGRQSDIELSEEPGRLCFRSEGGAAAIGEPRVLAPAAPEGSRPRWLVLTIVDALRADVVRNDEGRDDPIMPALSAMVGQGSSFEDATSPGCHTRASVWPILMGRDLMRIDPLKRRQSMPIQSPLEDTYSRANLFLGHLAENAGYHSIFLGNNAYLRNIPAFSRYSSWGSTDTGTLDTIRALPELLERYDDEPVLLLYYVSTPHAQSKTPRRWFDQLGCGQLSGIEQCRCNYLARARHADEALSFLRAGLSDYGLEGRTFEIVTADHGELFDDGMALEGEMPTFTTGVRQGAFQSFNRGHGNGCHALETDVPLVLYGQGVTAARHRQPVSGLDIVPTFLDVMGQAPVSRLDGVSLASGASDRAAARDFVAHGFCSDSRRRGEEQMIWWVQGCQLREPGSESLVTHHSELWRGETRVATNLTRPVALRQAMTQHEQWLRERLPSEAVVFHPGRLPPGASVTITLTDRSATITDFGPTRTVFGLDQIEVVDASATRLSLRFHRYDGLYYLTSLPERTPIQLSVQLDGRDIDAVKFIGPMQLPLQTEATPLSPTARSSFFVSNDTPVLRESESPAIGLWWHPYGLAGSDQDAGETLSDFDRVLREWGYIR